MTQVHDGPEMKDKDGFEELSPFPFSKEWEERRKKGKKTHFLMLNKRLKIVCSPIISLMKPHCGVISDHAVI